jgi:hypothetical protein
MDCEFLNKFTYSNFLFTPSKTKKLNLIVKKQQTSLRKQTAKTKYFKVFLIVCKKNMRFFIPFLFLFI